MTRSSFFWRTTTLLRPVPWL